MYDALSLPFDPDSVGSVARSGGTADPDPVIDALFDVFCAELRRIPAEATALSGAE